MFNFNKLLVAGLFALLAIVSGTTEGPPDTTDVEKNVIDTNPAEVAIITQLKIKESDADDNMHTYKCTLGTYRTNRLACTAHDTSHWNRPHDVELKLRCPKNGSGMNISYVEIVYSVTSASVNCHVNEGAIGLGYIGVTVNGWNTLLFNYSANFYTR